MYRYIYSSEIKNHISKTRAAQKLTMTILAYLGSIVMDVDLDDEDIERNILGGRYRLLEYATFFWPTLIYRINDEERRFVHVAKLLDRLVQEGRNYRFKGTVEDSKPSFENSYLQKEFPEAFAMVCEVFELHLDDKRFDWNWSNSKTSPAVQPIANEK